MYMPFLLFHSLQIKFSDIIKNANMNTIANTPTIQYNIEKHHQLYLSITMKRVFTVKQASN